MATAETAGLVLEADGDGKIRVIFPACGLRLNNKGVEVANLLRHENQLELMSGTPANFDSLESLEAIVLALVNGVRFRAEIEFDNYFL